ncbi:MAG: trehalose-6-phosphate synthase [Halodesulfurarchaeum sp.]
MHERTSDPEEIDEYHAGSPIGERSVHVVSNREPYSHEFEDGEIVVSRPAGGLTSALDPVLQSIDGTWIAWGSGEADDVVVDDSDHVAVPPDDPSYDIRRVWLSEDELSGYYYGFSNQVLWPVFHGFPSKANYSESFFTTYRDVNERFASVVLEEIESEDPIVWFHDYHFGLAPGFINDRLPESATLAQFWHIPWPPYDVFTRCPHGRAVLEGVLENDIVAVHTAADRDRLVHGARTELDANFDSTTGTITNDGDRTDLRVAPLPVDVEPFQRDPPASDGPTFWEEVSDRHDLETGTVAVGVDRLDYTKGIIERLDALARLWERSPEYRGELTYVQKASESRSHIDAYREYQDAVRDRVDGINDRFGTSDWRPIVFRDTMISQPELGELYRNADVALVTPRRDGLNLVAKEFVAAQDESPGVLVLGEAAGVTEEFGEHALTVTPLQTGGFAETIREAIEMPPAERRRRMRALTNVVRELDEETWIERVFGYSGESDGVGELSHEKHAFVR